MKFNLQQLDEKCTKRPRGYREAILAASRATETGEYEIKREDFKQIEAEYRLPSRLQMFDNLVHSLKDLLQNGVEKRNEAELKQVFSICADCEWLIEESMRCGDCGCRLKMKAPRKAWHCPKGKW